ncbi:MAG: ribbon-helix-helix protein, CopG family [Chloroflexota bacterium]|jgi:predicted transcriptional regulator
MGDLYRTQVLLKRSQHQALQQMAEAKGRSMSEIIREAVAGYLIEQTEEAEEQLERNALDRLIAFREKIEARYGVYDGNLVSEARSERERELEQTILNNP